MWATDQSHYRKYLATLGVALFVASVSLGGFILQLKGDLDIRVDDLSRLTRTAQSVIGLRHQLLLGLTVAAPYVIAAGVIGGIWLTIFGLKGWAQVQAELDRQTKLTNLQTELMNEKLRYEVREMTPEEKEQRTAEEVAEAVESIDDSKNPVIETPAPDDSVVVEEEAPVSQEEFEAVSRGYQRTLRREYAHVESLVFEKLQSRDGTEWGTDVAVATQDARRLTADAVGMVGGAIHRVLEIKMVSNRLDPTIIRRGAENLQRFQAATGAKDATLLVVARSGEAFRRVRTNYLQNMLAHTGVSRTILLTRAQLEAMPAEEFTDIVMGLRESPPLPAA